MDLQQRHTTRVRLDLLQQLLTMELTTDTQTMDLQQRQVRPQQLTGSEADEITSPLIKLNRTYFSYHFMCILCYNTNYHLSQDLRDLKICWDHSERIDFS